jgi:hypothetical protein
MQQPLDVAGQYGFPFIGAVFRLRKEQSIRASLLPGLRHAIGVHEFTSYGRQRPGYGCEARYATQCEGIQLRTLCLGGLRRAHLCPTTSRGTELRIFLPPQERGGSVYSLRFRCGRNQLVLSTMWCLNGCTQQPTRRCSALFHAACHFARRRPHRTIHR